jgi:hypothetical protein
VALSLARDHLERALQLSPLDQASSFAGLSSGASPLPANAEATPQPLEKDLATEMGAPPATPEEKPAQAPVAASEAAGAALRELEAARSLAAQVPPGDEAEASAHEVTGLVALAMNDNAAAIKEFTAIAVLPVKRGDGAAEARRDKAYLQLARLAYAASDDAQATELYNRVSRNRPEWLDALFEASWSRFRTTQDELALGNLLTLHAPFFTNRFFPESFVLKALVFYENCRYADARRALADFERRYLPLHQGLTSALGQFSTPQAAADFLSRGAVAVQTLEPGARDEVARVEQSPDIAGTLQAATQLAHEIDSLDQKPFRASALVARLSPAARAARLALLEDAGRKLSSRLDSERAQLRELLGQSLRISYEIAGREKDLAASPEGEVSTVVRHDRQKAQDDEELWPFQGEYWRDELGNYRYELGRRCKKLRGPSHLAAEPH